MMGGMFGFDDGELVRFRQAVLEERSGRALDRAVAKVSGAGFGLCAPHYKRVPRGFDRDHPRANWLLHRSLFARLEESPVPAAMHGSQAVEYCLERFKAMHPIQKWLVTHL